VQGAGNGLQFAAQGDFPLLQQQALSTDIENCTTSDTEK
jgi:hypothetical protein